LRVHAGKIPIFSATVLRKRLLPETIKISGDLGYGETVTLRDASLRSWLDSISRFLEELKVPEEFTAAAETTDAFDYVSFAGDILDTTLERTSRLQQFITEQSNSVLPGDMTPSRIDPRIDHVTGLDREIEIATGDFKNCPSIVGADCVRRYDAPEYFSRKEKLNQLLRRAGRPLLVNDQTPSTYLV
jgi:hypothetical protein